MSKNIQKLLESLGLGDVDQLREQLLSDDENAETIDTILKASQNYARPFLETEFTDKLNNERKSFKGKYLKEALTKLNREFGSPLTNKDIDTILDDPANAGQNYDAAFRELKTRVMAKTGSTEGEYQQMLDAANNKIQDYERTISDMEQKHKAAFDEFVRTGKLEGKLREKMISFLKSRTSMSAEKAADLLKSPLMQRALLKLNDQEDIDLFDPKNTEVKLKKSETELMKFDDLLSTLCDEYELPKIESGGAGTPPPAGTPPKTESTNTAPAMSAADAVASAFASAGV